MEDLHNVLTTVKLLLPMATVGNILQYLIPFNLSNLFALNYVPLLSRIHKVLEESGGSPLPWFGRINTLKMDTLLKLLYLFQTIPIMVPKSFFTSLLSLAIRFMWHRGMPRVKCKLPTPPKLQGGVDLPDYETYYQATHIARILEWFPPSLPKGFRHDRTRPSLGRPMGPPMGVQKQTCPSTHSIPTNTCLP